MFQFDEKEGRLRFESQISFDGSAAPLPPPTKRIILWL
jgi:hypothetical protein